MEYAETNYLSGIKVEPTDGQTTVQNNVDDSKTFDSKETTHPDGIYDGNLNCINKFEFATGDEKCESCANSMAANNDLSFLSAVKCESDVNSSNEIKDYSNGYLQLSLSDDVQSSPEKLSDIITDFTKSEYLNVMSSPDLERMEFSRSEAPSTVNDLILSSLPGGECIAEPGKGQKKKRGRPRKIINENEKCGKMRIKKKRPRKEPKEPKDQSKAEQTSRSCELCSREFPSARFLVRHMNMHSEDAPFKCSQCGYKLYSEERLQNHMLIHTDSLPHKCHLCGHPFRHRNQLEGHLLVHTGEKQVVCEICGRRFRKADCLIVHKRIHTGEKPYRCGNCGRCFNTSSSYKIHVRMHAGVFPYKCHRCHRQYTSISSLKFHMRSHAREDKGPAKSAIGSSATGAELELKRQATNELSQLMTSSMARKFTIKGCAQYKCTKCDKTLSSSAALKGHLKTHINAVYTCQECGKKYKCFEALKMHGRTHSRVGLYNCSQCEKGFLTPSRLTAHMRIHTGEKPFMCHLCSNQYNAACSLKIHMRTHTGDQPFKCDHCPAVFKFRQQMIAHRGHHTGELPLKCPHCWACYAKEDRLICHMQHRHPRLKKDSSTSGTRVWFNDGEKRENAKKRKVKSRKKIKAEQEISLTNSNAIKIEEKQNVLGSNLLKGKKKQGNTYCAAEHTPSNDSVKRKRGRPRKQVIATNLERLQEVDKPRRKAGRPRKIPLVYLSNSEAVTESTNSEFMMDGTT